MPVLLLDSLETLLQVDNLVHVIVLCICVVVLREALPVELLQQSLVLNTLQDVVLIPLKLRYRTWTVVLIVELNLLETG